MKKLKKLVAPLFGILFLILLVVYIGGGFSGEQVAPGQWPERKRPAPSSTGNARREKRPVWYEAVGTVKSVRRIEVAPQVQARIVSLTKSSGESVKKGEELARLDDARLQSRLRQAKEGVNEAQAGLLQARQSLLAAEAQIRQMEAHRLQALQTEVQTRARLAQAEAGLAQAKQQRLAAEARFDQATAQYERVRKFKQEGAATQQQLEKAEADFKQARAGVATAREGVTAAEALKNQLFASVEQASQGVEAAKAQVEQTRAGANQAKEGVGAAQAQVKRAEELVQEARIALGYTNITAPESGVVADRLAEPGDLALPGKPLFVLHNPHQLRLEANVPESLLDLLRPNASVEVSIDAIKLRLEGKVAEVVPSGDPHSRTFLVKISLPAKEGLFPGMFGRLRIRESERETVLAPANSVRRVGQLETVLVKTEQGWRERFVRTGSRIGKEIEILSGLEGNEIVGLEK